MLYESHQALADTAFRKSEKLFHLKPPDRSRSGRRNSRAEQKETATQPWAPNVWDIHQPNPEATRQLFGDRTVLTLRKHPGLAIYPGALTAKQQLDLAVQCVSEFPNAPATTNYTAQHGLLTGLWEAAQQQLHLAHKMQFVAIAEGLQHAKASGQHCSVCTIDACSPTSGRVQCNRISSKSDISRSGTGSSSVEATGAQRCACGTAQHDPADNNLARQQSTTQRQMCSQQSAVGSLVADAAADTYSTSPREHDGNGQGVQAPQPTGTGSRSATAVDQVMQSSRTDSYNHVHHTFAQQWTKALCPAKDIGPSACQLLRKLRWACVGPNYDWTKRVYLYEEAPFRPLPDPLIHLAQQLASCAEQAISTTLGPSAQHKACPAKTADAVPGHDRQSCERCQQPADCTGPGSGQQLQQVTGNEGKARKDAFVPDAALVNFYREGDTLGGHKDDVEQDLTQPIVTISLGCTAVFLMGGESRDTTPTALLLRSGDALVLLGPARRCYHGVPRVQGGTCTLAQDLPADCNLDDLSRGVLEYLNDVRINLSIRATR